MTQVLCLNVGSSSVKAAVFDGAREVDRTQVDGMEASLVFDKVVRALDIALPNVVAHRFVHGGPSHSAPAVVDDKLVSELNDLVELAPLHMPAAIDVLSSARRHFGDSMQIACFDTSFHHSMPEMAKRYALPVAVVGDVVRRYGFHGLSCENAVESLGKERSRRAIVAHLGSGCSVTAIADGKSVDTSMGLTPTGGVVMATRPGDLDPGLMVYLLRRGHDAGSLETIVNREAGILALAGSHDMKQVLAEIDTNPSARLAVEMFCYVVAKQIGAYAVTLGGFDTLVFTGGIGEHATAIREMIAAHLEFLRPFEVAVIPADEERVMAAHALTMFGHGHD